MFTFSSAVCLHYFPLPSFCCPFHFIPILITADAEESSRHGRQYLVNFPGPAAGATLLESGLFQKPELNPPCRTEEGL